MQRSCSIGNSLSALLRCVQSRSPRALCGLLGVCAVLLSAVACKPAATPVPETIDLTPQGTMAVHVGRGGITLEQLRAKLDALGAGKDRYRDPKELRAFVDNMVRFELLANEALKRGLDRDPEVQDTARRTMVQKLMNASLEVKEPSDEEVEKLYQQSISDFRQPERVQLAVLTLKSQADAEAALAKLKAAADAPADQRFLSEQEVESAYGPELAHAAFAVKEIGAVGPVIGSGGSFVVFKVTGRRAAFNRPLSEVGPGIRQRISRQKRNDAFEALVAKLRAEVPVTIDDAKLMEVWK